MATIKDIAKMTGISLGTISNYLNGKTILPENAEKIEKAIKETNYFPNNLGKFLRSGDTKTIGIIANDISAPYISKSVAVLEKGLSQKKYKILFCASQNNLILEENNLNFMISQAVNAIIFFPISYYKSNIENVLKAGLPLIMCDSEPYPDKNVCHTVNYSNGNLAFEATELLIKEGHSQIACISGTRDHYSSISRISGYREALQKHGIPFCEENIYNCDFDNMKSYAAATRMIKNNVTACLITVNNMLIGFLRALSDSGRNISYVTFSSEPYYDLLPIKPTYVKHSEDNDSVGQKTLEILEDILSSKNLPPIHKLAGSELILGDSHKKH